MVLSECGEVCDRLLRDKASRDLVWRELRPEPLVLRLLELNSQAHVLQVAAVQVALQLLWRMSEGPLGRASLATQSTRLRDLLFPVFASPTVAIAVNCCLVARALSEHADLRPTLPANSAGMVLHAAKLSLEMEGKSGEQLATASLAALAVLAAQSGETSEGKAIDHDATVRQCMRIHGTQSKDVLRWASKLLPTG